MRNELVTFFVYHDGKTICKARPKQTGLDAYKKTGKTFSLDDSTHAGHESLVGEGAHRSESPFLRGLYLGLDDIQWI